MVGINQVQVRPAIDLTFANALRSILRQDPDIIMVGEIRDFETAQLAVRASMTGHMVLSTIHTNDAIATITRLEDMGIEPYMLGPCLNLVIAQRLVRRICQYCKESYEEDPAIRSRLGIDPDVTLYHGTGCRTCMNTGYLGRTAIYEMVPVNRKLGRAINRGAPEEELNELSSQLGMTTLRHSGVNKIEQGVTTVEEVMEKTMALE